jgi:hypothetical protein
LLEMVLVLAVLGFMAGLVVARLDVNIPTYRLRLAAREIASTVSWVRSESIARAQPLGIRYDLDAGHYWVAFADETGIISDSPEPPRERFRHKELPAGVRFADLSFFGSETRRSGVATVRVSFLGACEGHLVHLVDDHGNSFTVEVLPLGVHGRGGNFGGEGQLDSEWCTCAEREDRRHARRAPAYRSGALTASP